MGYENRRSGIPFQKRATGVSAAWNRVNFPGKSIEIKVRAIGQAMRVRLEDQTDYFLIAAGTAETFTVRCRQLDIYSDVAGGTYELYVAHEGPGSL